MKSGILEVDDLDIQDERYVDQAMDIIGKLLGQIQYELETQLNERIKAIKNPIDEKERQELRKLFQKLQSDYQKLKAQIEALARDKSKETDKDIQAQRKIQDLEEKVKSLQTKCNDLQAKATQPPQNLQTLNNQLETLKRRNTELEHRYNGSQQELQESKELNNKFHKMLLKTHLQHQTSDFWLSKFTNLANQTQAIVRVCLDLNHKPKVSHGHRRLPRDLDLIRIWKLNLKPGERIARVEAAIFGFLNDEILLKTAFGLDDEDEGKVMEAGLVAFEKIVQEFPSRDDDREACNITEWRKLTYCCAKRIRKTNASTKIRDLASALKDFLAPLQKPDDRRLEELVLNLCTNAFTLSQQMREEPDTEFETYIVAPGSQIPEETGEANEQILMKPHAWETGYSEREVGTVAFTRFGGLMAIDLEAKELKKKGEGRVVLVSASVIVKAVND